jgi:hypothetical protein
MEESVEMLYKVRCKVAMHFYENAANPRAIKRIDYRKDDEIIVHECYLDRLRPYVDILEEVE